MTLPPPCTRGACAVGFALLAIAESACTAPELDAAFDYEEMHVYDLEDSYPVRVTPVAVSDERAELQQFTVRSLDDNGQPTWSDSGAFYVRTFPVHAAIGIPKGTTTVSEFLEGVVLSFANEALLGPNTLGIGGADVDWSMTVVGLENRGSVRGSISRFFGRIGNWLRDRIPALRDRIHEWRDQYALQNVLRTGHLSFRDRMVGGVLNTSETQWIRDLLLEDGAIHWVSLYEPNLDPTPEEIEGHEITCGGLGEAGISPARPDYSRPVPIEASFSINVTHLDASNEPITSLADPVPLSDVGPDCLNEFPECLQQVHGCLSEFPQCANNLADCVDKMPECAQTTARCATEFPACLDEVIHLRDEEGSPIIMVDDEGQAVTLASALDQPIYTLESGQRLKFDFVLEVRDAGDPQTVDWPGYGFKFSGLPILFMMETGLRPMARWLEEDSSRRLSSNQVSMVEAFKVVLQSMCGVETGHTETPQELLEEVQAAYDCGCQRVLFDHYVGAGPLAFDRVHLRISQDFKCEIDLDEMTCNPVAD